MERWRGWRKCAAGRSASVCEWTAVSAHVREMGVEYYDFRTACPDDQFRDAGHLLRRSAYEFTKKFYAEVLKLPVGELRSIE